MVGPEERCDPGSFPPHNFSASIRLAGVFDPNKHGDMKCPDEWTVGGIVLSRGGLTNTP